MTMPDRSRCIAALDSLMNSCEGISAGMLALRDGRPFVAKVQAGVDGWRFAEMASSLAALGQSVLRELKAGGLDYVLVEGAVDKLVIFTVPATGGLLLLVVLAEHKARLGVVLGHARICADAVAAAIPAPAKA